MNSTLRTSGIALLAALCGPTWSQTPPPTKSLAASAGLFAYPAKGQKPDQQVKDEAECYDWSKQQSGYDPMAPPPPPQQQQASAQQAKTAQTELANTFKRGMSVCLEARGYSVK